MSTVPRVLALALAPAFVVAAPLAAQSAAPARGGVRGVTRDAISGRALADVEVRLAGADTVVTRSDASGVWAIPALPAGAYAVHARRLGYAPTRASLLVRDGQRAELVLSLDAAPLALDQVVVTAARREQRLADAVTTTEVVTRDDIARTGASDLASVLVEQTGVQLQGGHPAGAGVMLQGIGSERVLVLLDGQPVAGRISGVFDISRIPTSAVERVEIVKGPQSTLYGTDAMGGVVNVVTRAPRAGDLGADLQVTGGTQQRREGNATVSLGRGGLSSRWTASRRTQGTTPGIAGDAGALATRTDGAARVRWAPSANRSVEASALLLDERQRWRSGALYSFGDNVQWSGRVTGAWQQGRHRVTPTVSGSVYDHLSRSSIASKPIAGDTGQRQLQRVYQGELLYSTRVGAHGIDAGVQVRRDETETARVEGGLRSAQTVEPFAQLEIVPTPALSLVPGVRVTRSTQWGTHVTPRVATRWRPLAPLTLRASAGTGFRAPDFKELFMRFVNTSAGYAVNGNPDLRPETSRNVTLGAEWAGSRTSLRAQVFHNRFTDFIETRAVSAPDAPPIYEYGNISDGSTRGVELEGGVSLRRARLELGYAGLATRDDATGRSLLSRPTHSGRAALTAMLPFALRTSLAATFTGRTPMQRNESGAVSSWRDAFTRADVRVARALAGLPGARGAELVVGADNLFDTQSAEWAGYTGRHVYTALSWTPGRSSDR